MSTVDITKDLENATLVVTSVFGASPDRVWRLWADPRQLERWWGPDPYRATVLDHELRAGGHVTYVMAGPDGDRHRGYWRVLEVEPPRRLVFRDGFADDDGEPDDDLPVSRAEVAIEAVDDAHTRMTITSTYDTSADFEQALAMGMEEGIRAAIEQIDALLAEG